MFGCLGQLSMNIFEIYMCFLLHFKYTYKTAVGATSLLYFILININITAKKMIGLNVG